MRNPHMKFQNISLHGSLVMLCTRKRDERTNVTNEQANERTNEWTDKPEAISPHFFFQNWGRWSRALNNNLTVRPQRSAVLTTLLQHTNGVVG